MKTTAILTALAICGSALYICRSKPPNVRASVVASVPAKAAPAASARSLASERVYVTYSPHCILDSSPETLKPSTK